MNEQENVPVVTSATPTAAASAVSIPSAGPGERTIRFGSKQSSLFAICTALGIGERRNLKDDSGRSRCALFVSRDELTQAEVELKRKSDQKRALTERRLRCARDSVEQTLSDEALHLEPRDRRTPTELWRRALEVYLLPKGTRCPMFEVKRRSRADLVTELATRRASEDGPTLTKQEREARYTRERRRARTGSRGAIVGRNGVPRKGAP